MILLSSGHGLNVSGARDLIDEVTEARRVTNRVGIILSSANIPNIVFHENTERTRDTNVNAIVRWHNARSRNLDVSIHFNSVDGGTRDAGIGVETLYLTGNAQTKQIASNVSRAISNASGLVLRRGDGTLSSTLGFMRLTTAPAILIEVCFVNSRTDVRLYNQHFEAICHAIAESISGRQISLEDENMDMNVSVNINGVIHRNVAGIVDGSTFTPARLIAEALGATVDWDNETRTVIIRGANDKSHSVDPDAVVNAIINDIRPVLTTHLTR